LFVCDLHTLSGTSWVIKLPADNTGSHFCLLQVARAEAKKAKAAAANAAKKARRQQRAAEEGA
jgi:hypothetical protein